MKKKMLGVLAGIMSFGSVVCGKKYCVCFDIFEFSSFIRDRQNGINVINKDDEIFLHSSRMGRK